MDEVYSVVKVSCIPLGICDPGTRILAIGRYLGSNVQQEGAGSLHIYIYYPITILLPYNNIIL